MTTKPQAEAAAKVRPEDRTPAEQRHVDNGWSYQSVRNADFKARGNKSRD